MQCFRTRCYCYCCRRVSCEQAGKGTGRISCSWGRHNMPNSFFATAGLLVNTADRARFGSSSRART